MFGKIWYNRTLKTYILGFGTLFNDIIIGQYDDNGKVQKKIKVPLQYSSKEQWYSNLKLPGDKEAAMILPTMCFMQNGIERKDDRRKAQKAEKVMIENHPFAVEAPQDWELKIKLSVIAGSQIEMDQIVEQIMHYFDPSFTIKLILCKGTINYVHDCPITLMSVSEADNNWLGDPTRRRINYDLQFRLIIKHFGPIYVVPGTDLSSLDFDLIEQPKSLGAPVEKIMVDVHHGGESGKYFNYTELQAFPREHRITVETEEGNIIEVFEDFYDGKIRNVVPFPKDVPAGSLT